MLLFRIHRKAKITKYVKNRTILFKSPKSNAIRGRIYARRNSEESLFAFCTFKIVPVGFCVEHSRSFKNLHIPIMLLSTTMQTTTILAIGIILSHAK
jgi:hypothetical protein